MWTPDAMKYGLVLAAAGAVACGSGAPSDTETVLESLLAADSSSDQVALVQRVCGDAQDEALLEAQLALANANRALAEANQQHHLTRAKELTADKAIAQVSIAKLPTKKVLSMKIAANGIALMLELSAVKGVAKGMKVTKSSNGVVCKSLGGTEVQLASSQGPISAWRPPNLETLGPAAVKLGAGYYLQSGGSNSERIPIVGAVIAISQAGADVFTINDVRQAMIDYVAILDKAIQSENTSADQWGAKAAAAQKDADAIQSKLDALKARPGQAAAGTVSSESLASVSLTEDGAPATGAPVVTDVPTEKAP